MLFQLVECHVFHVRSNISSIATIVIMHPLSTIHYSKNHIKSATFALHAFRQLLTQFLSDFHEIWQALFSSLTATSLKISRKNIM